MLALGKVLAGCLVAAVAGGPETVQTEVSALGGFKPAAAAPAEKSNPYQKAGDDTSECYAWAADGQCVANPGYMINSCKYSCWEWCVPHFTLHHSGHPLLRPHRQCAPPRHTGLPSGGRSIRARRSTRNSSATTGPT